MTTIKDIRDGGGECKKVATDFWECKDKDGKVWWCSDGGNMCVEKPKKSKTKKDLEKEGYKCKKVATDYWECTKDDKVWWCSDGGDLCEEMPKRSMSIRDLENEGAKCKQMSDDLWICHHPDGKFWACQGSREDSSCLIIHDPDEKKDIDGLPSGIFIREIQNGNVFELVGDHSVTVNDQVLEHRFNLIYEADGTFKSGSIKLGSGDNHIFTRKIQSDNSGYINSVTKFGPRIKGGSILATSAKAASKSSVIITGSIGDVPILPMAYVNKIPGKSCLECGEDVMHSPLLTIDNKEPSSVVIDSEILPAIEELVSLVRSDLFRAGHRSDLMFPPSGVGLWPGSGFWCIAACATAAAACIAGTSGSAVYFCLLAQASCEAACL
jgi:hypothetical protein